MQLKTCLENGADIFFVEQTPPKLMLTQCFAAVRQANRTIVAICFDCCSSPKLQRKRAFYIAFQNLKQREVE